MKYINKTSVTDIDSYYSVYFQDKIVESIYHPWDGQDFYHLEEAKKHIEDILVEEPEWSNRLTVFKISTEKVNL